MSFLPLATRVVAICSTLLLLSSSLECVKRRISVLDPSFAHESRHVGVKRLDVMAEAAMCEILDEDSDKTEGSNHR